MQGLIKLAKLLRAKPSERHCEIELCQAPQTVGQETLYLVNLREGHPDAEWQESSKTAFPVSLDKAEALFAQALASKLEQGYVDTAAAIGSHNVADISSLSHPSSSSTLTVTADHAMQWGHSSQTLTGKITKPADLQGQEKILLDRLPPRAWSGLSRLERTRTVWRIGERRLSAAVPRLVELIASGDAMLDYCIAHAIGRCADAGAALAMRELSQRSGDAHVRHIALHAWLALCNTEERQAHARRLISLWPVELQDAWRIGHEKQDIDDIVLSLLSSRNWKAWRHDDWLEELDCIALAGLPVAELARPLLLQQLQSLPVNLLVYRAFRHLYKLAEFRFDAELFGVLHQRFEKSWPLFSPESHDSHIYLERRYVKYSDEVKKPATRVAYSKLTREYLRRRSWRTLRRLGALSSPDFVHMAMGVLLACDDRHADKPHTQRLTAWNRQSRSYDVELRYHGPYATWMLFNQLVHQHDSPFETSRTARKWWQTGSAETTAYPARDKRHEAYPHLWDAAPDQLLHLLQTSLCLGVHAFAARALVDNQDYCARLDARQLQQLLQSPYLPTKEFAFVSIRQRFIVQNIGQNTGQMPDINWLTLLLTADYEPAAEFALECISKMPELYAQDAGLLLTMITSPLQSVRVACRLLAQGSIPETRKLMLSHILHWATSNTCKLQDEQVALLHGDMQWLLQNLLADYVSQLSDADLLAWCNVLLAPLFWQQALATDILLLHPAGIAHVAPASLRGLLQHDDASRQSLGSRLLAALPATMLLAQPDLVASLATASDARVRAAMSPVIMQLGSHAEFANSLLAHLIDAIFRSDIEEEEGSVHADIITWCSGPLLAATLALPADMQWRLLQARSKGAQELGSMLLNHQQGSLAGSLSVLQWALLGKHAIQRVRMCTHTYFTEHLPEVRQQLNDALRILDTRWPETRSFAADYFSSHITTGEWTLSQLLALCDHQQAAVQRLGRQLITQHFRVEEATEYVLSLSQHPAASMQLFVSQWLEQGINNAPDLNQALQHLQQLRPYFLSVLSHVNKARTVKNRVISFLQSQGLLSLAHTEFVAQIFTRQVLTVAIQDKAQYILGLTQLQAQYPVLAEAVDWPLRAVAPRVYAKKDMLAESA